MNSSISSFKTEVKVFAVVLVVMTALELRQYFRRPRLEGEVALMRTFPAMADNLAAERGTSMVLVGNSLTQTGYNMPLLRDRLAAEGRPDLHVENIALTGSAPAEWYHLFVNNFVHRGRSPNYLVINMSPDGIADGLPAGYRIGWLANETTWHDVPEVVLKDLPNLEVDGQYLQACISPLYADRWDIRISVLYYDGIWAGMQWINSGQLAAKPPVGVPPPRTYSLLSRMLQMARDKHVKVIFVAMPARDPYGIDPALNELLKDYGAKFLDCREIPGLTIGNFKDGWHLTPEGAKIFTPYMASRLIEAVDSKSTPG